MTCAVEQLHLVNLTRKLLTRVFRHTVCVLATVCVRHVSVCVCVFVQLRHVLT